MFIFVRLPKSNFISMHFISYKWFQLFQSTVSELRRPKSCGITAPVNKWFNSLLTPFLIFVWWAVEHSSHFKFENWLGGITFPFTLNIIYPICVQKWRFWVSWSLSQAQAQANNAYCGNSLVKVFTTAENFRTTLCISCQTLPHLLNHPSPMMAWVTNTTIGYPELHQSSLTSWSEYKLLGIKGSY